MSKPSLKESAPIITKIWNEEVVASSMFPESLKLADVMSVYKKAMRPWRQTIDQ